MSTHLPEEWGDPREHDPADVAELVKFRAYLRAATDEPRGSGRTWGDLYDEMYDNGDRMEDCESGGMPIGDGRTTYLDGE